MKKNIIKKNFKTNKDYFNFYRKMKDAIKIKAVEFSDKNKIVLSYSLKKVS